MLAKADYKTYVLDLIYNISSLMSNVEIKLWYTITDLVYCQIQLLKQSAKSTQDLKNSVIQALWY